MSRPGQSITTLARIAVATGWSLDQVRELTLDEATAVITAINEQRS